MFLLTGIACMLTLFSSMRSCRYHLVDILLYIILGHQMLSRSLRMLRIPVVVSIAISKTALIVNKWSHGV